MPKVQSRGEVIIDGKKIKLEDFDDTRASHTHKPTNKMSQAAEDELEKEVLRQTGHHARPGQSKDGGI